MRRGLGGVRDAGGKRAGMHRYVFLFGDSPSTVADSYPGVGVCAAATTDVEVQFSPPMADAGRPFQPKSAEVGQGWIYCL